MKKLIRMCLSFVTAHPSMRLQKRALPLFRAVTSRDVYKRQLKSYGISGRGRRFEVKQRVKEANAGRQHDAPGHRLDGTSHFYSELQANPYLAIDLSLIHISAS